MKFYILLIILSTSLISNSQKSLNLSIITSSDIDNSRLKIDYLNGDGEKRINDTFINNKLRIRFPFYAKYATIKLTYKFEDKSYTSNTFFVGDKQSQIRIYSNPKKVNAIELKYSKNILNFTDSSKNILYRDVIRCRKKASEAMTELYSNYGGKIERSDSLKKIRNQFYRELNTQTMDFVKKHSSEYFSLWFFGNQVVAPSTSILKDDTVYLRGLKQYFYSTFPKEFQQSYEGNYMMQMLEGVLNPPGMNSNVPNFSKTDLFGEKISIDKFKGKYVLLDFWASWCVPCLASVPVLKDLSKKYAADSFVIIGISIDEDKLKMKSSIKDKEMKWYHIWDYDNELSNVFAVFKIPTFLLIDKEGKIVFRGLGLEDKEKVANYLKDKLGNGN